MIDFNLKNNKSNLLEISEIAGINDQIASSSLILNTGTSQVNINELKNFINTFYEDNVI